MDINEATTKLAALAQGTRLGVFRLLLEYGQTGLPAGKLSDKLGVPHNTLSFHLAHLKQAGLVRDCRSGRQIIYIAQINAIRGLVDFLQRDCCRYSDEDCLLVTASRRGAV